MSSSNSWSAKKVYTYQGSWLVWYETVQAVGKGQGFTIRGLFYKKLPIGNVRILNKARVFVQADVFVTDK